MFWKRNKNEITDSELEMLKHLHKAGKDIVFSTEDKIRAKARVFQMMRQTEQIHDSKSLHINPFSKLLRLKKVPVIFSLIIIFGLSTTAGIARANEARPGDTLFSVDKIIEDLQLLAALDPEIKLKLQLAFAAERIQELEELTEEIEEVEPTSAIEVATTPSTSTPEILEDTSEEVIEEQVDEVAVSSPLEQAIELALVEVDDAISKAKDDAIKLKVKVNPSESFTKVQEETFFNQVIALIEREGVAIEKLRVKTSKKKMVLTIKIDDDLPEDEDEKDEDNSKSENNVTVSHDVINDIPVTSSGSDGEDGEDGEDGKDGKDGKDGEDGEDSYDNRFRPSRSERVELCHNLRNDLSNGRTIKIQERGVDAHLGHGDTLGPCEYVEDSLNDEKISNEKEDDNKNEEEDVEEEEEEESKLEINDEEIEAEGVIEYVDDDVIVVFGKYFLITYKTEIEIKKKRSLSVGSWAEVKGIVEGDIIYAKKIEVK